MYNLWPIMGTTSIQVDTDTRDLLASLKEHPRETYDAVLRKLMALVPAGDDEGPYSDAFRVGLLSARLEIARGDLVDHEDVKRQLGLT